MESARADGSPSARRSTHRAVIVKVITGWRICIIMRRKIGRSEQADWMKRNGTLLEAKYRFASGKVEGGIFAYVYAEWGK